MRLKQAPAGSVQYIRPCAPPKQGYLVKMQVKKCVTNPFHLFIYRIGLFLAAARCFPNFTLAISVQYRDLV